jgi:hypothetical protein
MRDLDGGGLTEMFPDPHNIFLEGLQPSGPIEEGIGQFCYCAAAFWSHYGPFPLGLRIGIRFRT